MSCETVQSEYPVGRDHLTQAPHREQKAARRDRASGRATPSLHPDPGETSHPDCRASPILIVARQVWSRQVSTDLLRPYAAMWNAPENRGPPSSSTSTTVRPERRSMRRATG